MSSGGTVSNSGFGDWGEWFEGGVEGCDEGEGFKVGGDGGGDSEGEGAGCGEGGGDGDGGLIVWYPMGVYCSFNALGPLRLKPFGLYV